MSVMLGESLSPSPDPGAQESDPEFIGNVPKEHKNDYLAAYPLQVLKENTAEAFRALCPNGINEVTVDNNLYLFINYWKQGSEIKSIIPAKGMPYIRRMPGSTKPVKMIANKAYSEIQTSQGTYQEGHEFDRLPYHQGAHQYDSFPLKGEMSDYFPRMVGQAVIEALIGFRITTKASEATEAA